MTIETKVTCPLGSVCEEVKEDGIHRCAWYTHMKGIDAQGDDTDENACAIGWMPTLTVELIRGMAQVQASTDSSRNVNDVGLTAVADAMRATSPIAIRGNLK